MRSAAAASMHRRRGGEKIRPVMLADAEHFEADLVGQLDLFHQVAQPLRRIEQLAGRRVGRVLDERVDADFHSTNLRVGAPEPIER